MSSNLLFSGEMSVYEDEDTGLRIECSEKHVEKVRSYLAQRGFVCGAPEVVVSGAKSISNFVAFSVKGALFDILSSAVKDHLEGAGVKTETESFNSLGEKHLRFNLKNVSVFDK